MSNVPTFQVVPVSKIVRWVANPVARIRRDQSYRNLLASMQRDGQLQPVGLVDNGDGTYTLFDGHRRFTVAIELGWPSLNAMVWPVGTDVGKLAIAANTGVKVFGGQALTQVLAHDKALIEWVTPTQANRYRAAMELLGDAFSAYASRFGPRAYDVAKRVSRRTGLDTRNVLLWMLDRDDGVVRALEYALKTPRGCSAIVKAVNRNEPLVMTW